MMEWVLKQTLERVAHDQSCHFLRRVRRSPSKPPGRAGGRNLLLDASGRAPHGIAWLSRFLQGPIPRRYRPVRQSAQCCREDDSTRRSESEGDPAPGGQRPPPRHERSSLRLLIPRRSDQSGRDSRRGSSPRSQDRAPLRRRGRRSPGKELQPRSTVWIGDWVRSSSRL
jgi:hypothetical protein